MAQRAQADLVNYRRRAGEEMDELRRTANSHLLLQILSFLDDLDRALALVSDDAVAPGWLEGLRLVRRNMDNILDLEGVSKIEAEGQPFEPWEFEAVQYQETEDVEEGRVIEVVRNGYKHHDKVLRAAQVVVAKRPEPQTGQANKQEDQ
jgi:molecular chaperone GrpE